MGYNGYDSNTSLKAAVAILLIVLLIMACGLAAFMMSKVGSDWTTIMIITEMGLQL